MYHFPFFGVFSYIVLAVERKKLMTCYIFINMSPTDDYATCISVVYCLRLTHLASIWHNGIWFVGNGTLHISHHKCSNLETIPHLKEYWLLLEINMYLEIKMIVKMTNYHYNIEVQWWKGTCFSLLIHVVVYSQFPSFENIDIPPIFFLHNIWWI